MVKSFSWFTSYDPKKVRKCECLDCGQGKAQHLNVSCSCKCCRQCWAYADIEGRPLGPQCIHGGPYDGYTEV